MAPTRQSKSGSGKRSKGPKHHCDHRSQADHNREVCLHLHNEMSGQFNDWVVTTAYYSAIHYFYSDFFPGKFEINGKFINFTSFDQWYSAQPIKGKHEATFQLVKERFSDNEDLIDSFQRLKDLCWSSRYKNWKIEDALADFALDCLKQVREAIEVA